MQKQLQYRMPPQHPLLQLKFWRMKTVKLKKHPAVISFPAFLFWYLFRSFLLQFPFLRWFWHR